MGFNAASKETLEDCFWKLKDIIIKDWNEKFESALSNELNPKTYAKLFTFSRKKPSDEDYEKAMINGVFIFDIFFKQIPDSELPPLISFLKEFFANEGLSFFTMQDKLAERKTTHLCVGIPRQFLNTKSHDDPEETEGESFDIGSAADFPAMS